jgi:hypothetical protein
LFTNSRHCSNPPSSRSHSSSLRSAQTLKHSNPHRPPIVWMCCRRNISRQVGLTRNRFGISVEWR